MDLGEKCRAYGVLGICGGVIPFDVKYSAYCGGCHNIPSGSSFQPTQVPSESDSTVAFEPTSVPSFTFGTSMHPTTVPTSRVSASLLPTSVPSDSSVQTSGLNTLTSDFGTPEPSDFAVEFEPTSVPSFSVGSSLRPTSEPSNSSFQTSAVSTSQPSSFDVLTLRDLRQIRRAFKNPPSSALFAQLRVLVDRLASRNQNLVPAVAATIDDLQNSLGGRYHPRAFRQAKRTFRQLNNLVRATQK